MSRSKYLYSEPQPPVPGTPKFKIVSLTSVSERACHFPSSDQEEYDLDEEDNPESSGELPTSQSISLKEVNTLLQEKGLSDEDIYFTASFDEDHLSLEVVQILSLDDEEQQEEYQTLHAEWQEQQDQKAKNDLQRLQREIESLQWQAEKLKNK